MWNVTGSLCLPYHKRARVFCALHVLENKYMTNTVLCARAGGGGEEGKCILSLGAAGARHHRRKPCLSAALRDPGPSTWHLQQLKDGSLDGELCSTGWGFLIATQSQEEWWSQTTAGGESERCTA